LVILSFSEGSPYIKASVMRDFYNAPLYGVYIMTNQYHTVLYTGVTNNILRRSPEHKEKRNPNSFTAKYNLTKLVWYDTTDSIGAAIEMEKRIKGWTRAKKIALITERNPQWNDLSDELGQ